ncbi:glutamate--cysteine ligase [Lactobacillaceae bacterium Melli_B4]
MFSKIGQTIFDHETVAKTSDFKVGLEVEMDRADTSGHLSSEPYPSSIGDEKNNPWLTTDYLEAMSEMVTPPADNAHDAIIYLYRINTTLRLSLAPGEILWPLSMPPIFPENKGADLLPKTYPSKVEYLKKYIKKYSFVNATPCGIHINMSIRQSIIDLLAEKYPERFKSKAEVKTYLYLKLGQDFIRYRWLLTYLFGASPIAQDNYFDSDKKKPSHPIRSIRQSTKYGYGADFFADYTSLDAYVESIKKGVKDNKLLRIEQGQGPIRFKGNNDIDKLKEEGIKYIELRMLDLDPTSSIGIRTDTIRFIRIMAIYFIMNPGIKTSEINNTLEHANQMNDTVAEEKPDECTYAAQALAMIREIEKFVDDIQAGPEYQEILQEMEIKIKYPELTNSAQLAKHIKNGSLIDYAVELGEKYQDGAKRALRPFRGFEDEEDISAEDLKRYLLDDIEDV